jgi:hypothetical protein
MHLLRAQSCKTNDCRARGRCQSIHERLPRRVDARLPLPQTSVAMTCRAKGRNSYQMQPHAARTAGVLRLATYALALCSRVGQHSNPCLTACARIQKWSYVLGSGLCWLKDQSASAVPSECCTSGSVRRLAPPADGRETLSQQPLVSAPTTAAYAARSLDGRLPSLLIAVPTIPRSSGSVFGETEVDYLTGTISSLVREVEANGVRIVLSYE